MPFRRYFIPAAVLSRAEGHPRRRKGRVRGKLVPNRGWEGNRGISGMPRIRVAEDEGGFRSPWSRMKGSRVGRASFDLDFSYCPNCHKERREMKEEVR